VRVHWATSVVCVLGCSDVDDLGDIQVFGIIVLLRFRGERSLLLAPSWAEAYTLNIISEASIAYFIRVSSSKNERGDKISLLASGADYAVARLFVEMLRRDTDYYRK